MQGWMFRHGATCGNTQKRYIGTTDEPLIEEERTDLPAAAEKWKKLGLIPADVPVVFTSPMLRCRETASLFYPHAEQVVIDSLRECDFGDFENKNPIFDSKKRLKARKLRVLSLFIMPKM